LRQVVAPTFYPLHQPILQVLEELSAAGIRLVELYGDSPRIHVDLMDDSAVEAVRQALDRLPIKVYSIHAGFSNPSEEAWDISEPDAEKRRLAVERHETVLRAAKKLGAHHVVIHPGIENRNGRRFEDCRESIRLLAESAREAGVLLAVENMPPTYLGATPDETRSLLEGMDPKAVGFCLDTGHAMLGNGGVGDFFKVLGRRIVAIQWHDNDGKNDEHLYPGEGKNSWDEFFAGLDRFNIDLPVTVEAAPPEGITLETAVAEVQQALVEGRTPRLNS